MAGDIPKTCGIVRPIAPLDGLSAEHWSEVHNIIVEALGDAFETKLVSDAEDAGVIQGRIVKNLFEADLVICDVSGRNANVMFELGMRLAFDKPTIVIKDDVTAYSFDSSPIEHIPYPRSLRFSQMIAFKEDLLRKALATVQAPSLPGYRSFLQHFGPIQVASIDHEQVPAQDFVINQLSELRADIARLSGRLKNTSSATDAFHEISRSRVKINIGNLTPEARNSLLNRFMATVGVRGVEVSDDNVALVHLDPGPSGVLTVSAIQNIYRDVLNGA